MKQNETTKPTRDGGAALNGALGWIDIVAKEREQLWGYVKNCVENNIIPEDLPLDAVLFVSSDRFDTLHRHFKIQFAGRVFADGLLEYNTMVIMKRPNASLKR